MSGRVAAQLLRGRTGGDDEGMVRVQGSRRWHEAAGGRRRVESEALGVDGGQKVASLHIGYQSTTLKNGRGMEKCTATAR